MNMQERAELILIATTALICIAISILDFTGALDSITWLAKRISVMTLLAVGLVALYLVTERSRKLKDLEETIKRGNDLILNKINPDNTSQKIIDTINTLWKEREDDIQKLFDQIAINTASADHSALRKYLASIDLKLLSGDVFGTKQPYPWDFNITAIDLKGDYIYHRIDEMISTRAAIKIPHSEILKMKTGTLFWPNEIKSESMNKLFPYQHFKTIRFTKVYFRELGHLNAIIAFQSHINVLYQLPKLENPPSNFNK